MSLENFETSLRENSSSERERNWIRTRVYAAMADLYYWDGEFALARRFYRLCLKTDPRMGQAWLKNALLSFGNLGILLRKGRGQLYEAAKGVSIGAK